MLLAAARRLLPALCLIAVLVPPAAGQELDVAITYLGRQEVPPIPLSLVEPVLVDEGIKGAQQAIRDNQTTGRFLKHSYRLNERVVPPDGDIAAEFNAALANPRIRTRLTELTFVLMPGTAAEFGAQMAATTEKWGRVIRAANIKPD